MNKITIPENWIISNSLDKNFSYLFELNAPNWMYYFNAHSKGMLDRIKICSRNDYKIIIWNRTNDDNINNYCCYLSELDYAFSIYNFNLSSFEECEVYLQGIKDQFFNVYNNIGTFKKCKQDIAYNIFLKNSNHGQYGIYIRYSYNMDEINLYLNKQGLHSIFDLPATQDNYKKEYMLFHKHYRLDGPSVEYNDGGYEYKINNGNFHNKNGPARCLSDGTVEYYIDGKIHRKYGPARILPSGIKEWYENGILVKKEHPDGYFKDKIHVVNNSSEEMVYFIQGDISKIIKIGYSSNYKKRMKSLQSSSGENQILLKIIPGSRKLENEIHELFDHLRINRIDGRKEKEWFKDAPELLDFINNCK